LQDPVEYFPRQAATTLRLFPVELCAMHRSRYKTCSCGGATRLRRGRLRSTIRKRVCIAKGSGRCLNNDTRRRQLCLRYRAL
jgi:hypothetical protein